MTTPYTVGDTSPSLTGTINADGTGAAAVANIARPDGTVFTRTVVLSAPSPSSTTWTAALAAGNLSIAGTYRVEVQVTFSGGGIQTFAFDADGQYNSFDVRDQIA